MSADSQFNSSNFMFCEEEMSLSGRLVEKATEVLKAQKSPVQKVQVVNESIVVLLENGTVWSWGDNTTGNLGHNRNMLDHFNVFVVEPKQVSLDGVQDIALSDNILTLLTESGQVYYTGIDKDFLPKPVSLPKNTKVKTIGASHNNYLIVDTNNKLYAKESYENEEDIKFYGQENIFELDNTYFN